MSEMTVSFWGTRGSIATPGRSTQKYGGNTTCLEVRYRETLIVLDAGTGMRDLGLRWMEEFSGTAISANIFFTHLHWDHIQGFPFFAPAYSEQNRFVLYGEDRPDGGLEQLLGNQMRGVYFPATIEDMRAELRFFPIQREYRVGDVLVRVRPLPHPGGCLAFRLEVQNAVFVFATDCELDQIAINQDEICQNHAAQREFEPEFLSFFEGANLIVIDCQYTDQEYPSKIGWGHNSVAAVVDFCHRTGPDMLALTHHDPSHCDRTVAAIVADTSSRLARRGRTETLVFAARENFTLKVQKPKRSFPLETTEC